MPGEGASYLGERHFVGLALGVYLTYSFFLPAEMHIASLFVLFHDFNVRTVARLARVVAAMQP